MSAAFVASPASSEGLHDGYHSRMRLDTHVQRQQHHHNPQSQPQPQDAQSFLSAESPFEEISLSPTSFVLISPEESSHAHSSDIGAEDWQLMPSPRNHYNAVPFTTAADIQQAQAQSYRPTAHYVPRNLSVTSSLSSVAASAAQYHSPLSSSPVQPFRRQSPYYPSPSVQGQQQTFAESFNQWSTAAPMQTLTTAAPDTMLFFPQAGTGFNVVPSNSTPPSYATAAPSQGPWSVHGQRNAREAQADTPIFGPEGNYTWNQSLPHTYGSFQTSFTSAPEQTISPGTRENPVYTLAWPLPSEQFSASDNPEFSFTNHDLDGLAGGEVLQRHFSIGGESFSSSDVTDPRSRYRQHDEAEATVRPPFQHTPSPMVKIESNTPPLQDEPPQNLQFEPYVPEPATQHHFGPERSSHTSKRVGGRQLGSKFEPDKAERIKKRREDGACWTCSLQRDECSGGDVCRRCSRRMQRPNVNSDVVLMCDRTKLQDLKGTFIPPILTSLYERKAVESFARVHIAHWFKKPIQVPCKLIWGFEPIMVEMYEFHAKDEIIRNSQLGIENHRAQRTDIEARKSPPLGMMMVDLPEANLFSREFDDIVDNWLDIFVARFYSKDEDDFAPRLLDLMAGLGRADPNEHKFLRDVFRLLVVTYVLSHAVTIAESQRYQCLSQLQTAHPSTFPKHCGSKLANRQLKHLFSTIRDSLTDRILKQLSQFLKSSKRYSRWTSAFCAILGLAIAKEQSMQLVHLIFATEARDGMVSEHEAYNESVKACERIEDRFIFITKLFRLKYHAKFNPLRDHEKDGVKEHLSPKQLEFVNSVAALCAEKGDYLRQRADVKIAPDNSIQYTARLVSKFMLSFWP